MKMNMKRIMAVLCALLMLCALAACGDDNSSNNNQQANNDGPSAYELYTQASEKMNALESAEYDLSIDMVMAAQGETMNMTMNGNMKQVKTGEGDADFDLAMLLQMDMSDMGAGVMDTNMYYTNGYMYFDMNVMGQAVQMKAAMDMETASEQMTSTEMADIEESWIKESSVNGNNIHLVVDGTNMMDYVEQYSESITQSLGAGGSMSLGDITIDMTIDSEGMPVTYKMLMPMTMTTQGVDVTMDMDMTMDIVATEGITIDFPADMESYMEVDASQLGM